MRQLRAWFLRLSGAFHKRSRDSEFADELESHIQMHIDDNLRAGMTCGEARRQALIKLGGVESTKEKYRQRHSLPALESLLQDVRYGLRVLGRSPGFTAIALLTLAFGIGANTAIFSLLNALVLRTLPVRQPERLVSMSILDPGGEADDLSFPLFEQIEQRQQSFSATFAYWGDSVNNVEADGQLSRGDIWAVTGNFCSELGLRPHLGRLLDSADVTLHQAPSTIAVIGNGFWQRHYGGAPNVIGKTVQVEGVPFTVIGVMQKGFTGMGIASEPDVIVPLTAEPLIFGSDPNRIYTSSAHSHWLSVAGRLKDGITLGQARADIETIWPGVLEATLPESLDASQRAEYLAQRIEVETAARGKEGWLRKRFTRPVSALMGVSALILLIACVNLASLTLARAASRSHELGVRAALGASRFRLGRQLMVESLLLSLLGAAAAMAIANWVTLWLRDSIMREFIVPPALDVAPDGRVFAVTAGIAIVAAILFGIGPAFSVVRGDPARSLQQSSRTIGGSTGRLGRLLIAAQVALSVVMLMSAGLFVRSFGKLRSFNPGFRKQDVLLAKLFPMPGGYKNLDNASYYPELVDRISRIPGVRRASMSHVRPLLNMTGNDLVAPASADAADGYRADLQMVSPQFFETLGISLLEGRDFTWRDHEKAPRVAVLGRRLAGRLFPTGGAIGGRIRIGTDRARQNVEIVGVVSDASLWSLREPESLEVYIPLLQGYAQWSELIVWQDGTTPALMDSVRREVQSLGHEYSFRVTTLAGDADQSMMEERLTAMLSGFYALLSLLLAAVGLYGLVSYTVTRRTREIGIRMALGAKRASVLWMVLGDIVILVGSGVVVGVPCALFAARLIGNLLFGLSPSDPITLAFVAVVLLGTGVSAAYLPARRASRSDPLVALRYE